MSAIWITGARGFIGRHLAKDLTQRGHRVCGLGHGAWPERDAASWGITQWVNGDVQPSNLRQLMLTAGPPDTIFHLAGGSSVGAAIASPHEDFSRTVDTTARLLDWTRLESPSSCIVAVSSAAVYGAGHHGGISEDQAQTPFSPYGYHKLMMEQLCRSYAATYGTRVAVARLFSVYGSFLRKQLLWDLCTKLASGDSEIKLGGTGGELRDWTDVRDVTRALFLIRGLASEAAPIVNVGSGTATSVREVADLVSQAWPAPARIAFSGESRAGDPFSLVADNRRLNGLGFQWQVPVDKGLSDYVQWYLGQAGLPR